MGASYVDLASGVELDGVGRLTRTFASECCTYLCK